MQGALDLASLFRANASVPVPVDEVLVELRRLSDSSVAFTRVVTSGQFSQNGDSLVVPITLELSQPTESFYLYAEARGGGVVYYSVNSTVTATAGQSTQTPEITPVYVGPGSTADSVVLALSSPSVATGGTVQVTATVYQGLTPVAGVPVGYGVNDSTALTVQQSGLSTAQLQAGSVPGTYLVVAETPTGLADTATLTVTVPPVPSTLSKLSGDNQVLGGAQASQPLVVQVLDQFGQPLAGAPVSFALVGAPAGTTIAPGSTTTDGAGLAQAIVTAGQASGSFTAQATSGALPAVTFALSVSVVPVPTSVVKISGDNQAVAAGQNSQPVVLEVRDQFGAPVVGFAVGFALVGAPSGTVIQSAASSTDNAGRAQAVITAGATPGSFTVQATAAGLTGSPLAFAMGVTVPLTGPATVTALSATAQAGTVGQPVAAPPSVEVRDSNNVLLPGVTVTFAPAPGTNGSVTGGTQTTNASGVATVGSWTLDAAPGDDTLFATVATLPPVRFVATSTAGVPASVAIVSGDAQTAPAASQLSAPLVVVVRDAQSNPVPGVLVTWATPDGGTLAPATSTTGATGQATTTWTLGPSAPSQVATASVSGVGTPASFTATATFGPPSITLSYPGLPNVGLGKGVTVRATIPAAAPAGGVAVTLTSDLPGTASVGAPATQTIPQGSTFIDFTVTGVSLGSTTLRGDASGYVQGTLPITVEDRSISVPSTLSVAYTGTQSLPIVIGAPAPVGGVVITVSSDNPAAVGVVTPTVTINAGSTTANATVSGVLPGTANVTVDNPAYSSDVSVVSTVASLNVTQTSVNLNASFGTGITLSFETGGTPIAAPVGGIAVTLTPRNTACVNVANATIPAGQTTVGATLTAAGGPFPCSTYVVATAANLQPDSVLASVAAVPDITLSGSLTVGAGLQVGQSLFLGASNHPGVTVHLVTPDSNLVRLAPNASTAGTGTLDVVLGPGVSSANWTIQGVPGQLGTATVIATAPGFNQGSLVYTTVTPAMDMIFLPGTTTTFSANSGFQVRLGIPNGQLTGMAQEQALAVGGSLTVNVVNDSLPVGDLVTFGTVADSVTTVIAAGSARTPSGAASGGVDFDPVNAGVATLRANAPGFISLPTASQSITVSAPAITLSQPNNPGAGMQVGTSAFLGASNHGGITVRLVSSDSTKLLLTSNANVVGNDTLDVNLLNGSSSFGYTIQAKDGQTGTVDIVATAPGFTPDTVTVTLQPVALDVIFLPGTTTSLAPNSTFQVRVGVPNGQLTGMAQEQALWAGSPGFTVTVTTSPNGTGQLVGGGGQLGDTITTTIAPLTARSPSGAANGGTEYDPVTPGADTVGATIPGFIALPTARQVITVTGQAITLSQPSTVGSGMQVGSSAFLGASQHGGVTVTLVSQDSSKLILAPNGSTVGAGTLAVAVPNGSTSFGYNLQALEGATGTVDVIATAPGFTPATITVQLAAPAIDIIFLGTSTTTFSPNQSFQARIGVPNGQGTAMAIEEALRPGSPGLAVTIVSSTPAVGALVTSLGSGNQADLAIVAGQARTPSGIGNGGVDFDPILGGSTTVTATAPGYLSLPTASVTVTVSSPGITLSATTVGDGLQTSTSGFLGASNHGGVTVRVTSSDPAIALVSPNASTPGTAFVDIPVANGVSGFSYYVQGVEGAAGVPVITATAPGFTDGSASATVVPSAMDLIFLGASTTTLTPPTAFQFRLGYPNGNNTAMAAEQAIRAGGAPVTVAVSNSNGSVATLQFQGGPAQGGSVTIQPGAARTPSPASNGGVEFQATAAGVTVVSGTTPNYLTLPTASQTVTISTPTISVSDQTVGSSLQLTTSLFLGASQHGGITVRVTSNNPSLFLISPNTTTAGSAFVDFPLSNGQTGISFVIQGVPGATGTATYTVTAPGYSNGTGTVTVVQPAADVIFLPSTISAGAANAGFQVRTGIPDQLGNNLSQEQALAAGLADVPVTVTNSNATAADLVTTVTTGQSVQTVIQAGSARSPNSLATGGVQFDPKAAGVTTVSATLPGFRVIPASSFTVTVQ